MNCVVLLLLLLSLYLVIVDDLNLYKTLAVRLNMDHNVNKAL